MYPELNLSKILSYFYALGIYTIVGLKEVPFWSISSSELTVVNVFLLLNYLSCCYLKTNKISICFSL